MSSDLEHARKRLLYDVSEEDLARMRREQAHVASWGRPKRCETNIVSPAGDCLFCGEINGAACRDRRQEVRNAE